MWGRTRRTAVKKTRLSVETLESRDVPAVSFTGADYLQPFDGLPKTGAFTLSGNGPHDVSAAPINADGFGVGNWFLRNATGSGPNAIFRAGTGSDMNGAVYSFGTISDADRSLGSLASGTVASQFGVVLVNDTGVTINQFSVSFTGEQWRRGNSPAGTDTLTFAYAVGVSSIDANGFTAEPSLNFTSPNAGTTTGAINGNLPANRLALSKTITGVSWAAGETLVLRWTDTDSGGSDDGLAIDDLTFSAPTGGGDTTAPTVTFDDGDADDTVNVGSVLTYTVQFSETVTGVDVTDFEIASGSTATGTIGGFNAVDGDTYTVQVTTTGAGSLKLGIKSGVAIVDAANNPLVVPAADDTTITVNAVTQPANATVTYGDNAQFTANISGTPAPTVQWQVLNGGTWTDLANGALYSGVTTTTLSLTRPAVALSGSQYRAVLANPSGTVTTNPATLTVTPKALTATATAANKTYDGNTSATVTITLGGVVGLDDVTGSATGTFADKNVGTGKAVTVGTVTLSGADAGNYTVGAAANTTADITARAITVTADANQGKTVGAADPTLTFAVTSGSLVDGDAFSGSLSRDPGETAGDYAITQGTLTAGTNYNLTFVGATFTIVATTAPVVTTSDGTTPTIEQTAIAIDTALTVIDADSADLTGATVAITGNFVAAQDVLAFTDQNGISGTYTNGVLTLTGTSSVANYQTALRSVTYENTSDAPDTSPRTITFTATDGTTTSAAATKTVSIAAVNDGPVNTVPGTQTVAEDATLTFSAAGGNLISVTDADAGEVRVALTATNGTFTLTDESGLIIVSGANGTDAFTFRAPLDVINARLAEVVFNPTPDFNGEARLQIVTSDLGNTGDGGEMTDDDTIIINVTEVNDAPTAGNDPLSAVTEDSGARTIPFSDLLGNDSAGEAGQTLTITAVGDAVGGTVVIDGTNVIFTPAADFSGAASFTYTIEDDGTTSGADDPKTATGSVSFTVTPVNDAPEFTLNGDPPVAQNAGPQTVANFATGIRPGPITATDEGEQKLEFLITTDNDALFAAGPAIDPTTGTLTYTPAAGMSGTATVTVLLQDEFLLESAPQTFTITVNAPPPGGGGGGGGGGPVNTAPSGADATLTLTEDSPLTLAAANFGFSDAADPAPNTFAGVVITTLPSAGTLVLSGTPVTTGQLVAAADFGNLTFVPVADAAGENYASFTFQVRDTGPAGSNLDPTPNTITFNVTAVNDPPALALVSEAILISTGGEFAQAGFATFGPGGGADEASQQATLTVVAADPALFAAQPAIGADGRLTFTPAPGAGGTTTVTVTASDGLASVERTFTIQVTALEVPPGSEVVVTPAPTPVPTPAPTVPTVVSSAVVPGGVAVTRSDDSVVNISMPGAVATAVVADVNGGGPDVLILLANGTLMLVDGATRQLLAALGDFNANGTTDFVFTLADGTLAMFDGATRQLLFAVGDLNGDGTSGDTFVQMPNGRMMFRDAATGTTTFA